MTNTTPATQNDMFPTRIGRVSFLVRYILFMIIAVLGSVALGLAEGMAGGGKAALSLVAAVVLLVSLFYFIRYILVPRVRDTGLHWALCLLMFVPLVNFLFLLALLFIPADQFIKADRAA